MFRSPSFMDINKQADFLDELQKSPKKEKELSKYVRTSQTLFRVTRLLLDLEVNDYTNAQLEEKQLDFENNRSRSNSDQFEFSINFNK